MDVIRVVELRMRLCANRAKFAAGLLKAVESRARWKTAGSSSRCSVQTRERPAELAGRTEARPLQGRAVRAVKTVLNFAPMRKTRGGRPGRLGRGIGWKRGPE